ncbi:adenosine deaminase [Candidatus Gottesmanbacteria bacterium]|nr:adenosine deaminase [Candidatus Gottesmanbacteria bacterium]
MTKIQHSFGELAELHVHVGSAVDPPIMWEIAHEQGIKLPTKNYWEFEKLITVSDITTYQKYLDLFHWTELIQSSPEAIEKSIYSIASGAYRKNNITTLEIRFNPMKRNRGGERDLDHIILAAIHGMEKAELAYQMRVGLILMFDRTFTPELNNIIGKKAIKYRERGVVGIDLAGPIDKNFHINSLVPIVDECKKEGLGVTIHSGEATGADEVKKVVDLLSPDRIGHGVRSVEDEAVLEELSKRKIVLEVCPSSNIHTQVVKDLSQFKEIFGKLKQFRVPFTINTDGPEMLKTNLVSEYEMLLQNNILTIGDLQTAAKVAEQASFIK